MSAKKHSDDSFELAISGWLTHLRAERKRPATIEQYHYHVDRLRIWLAEGGIERPAKLKPAELERWLAEINSRWSAAAVHVAVHAARSFVIWQRSERILKKKQSKRLLKILRAPPVGQNPQRTLTMDEIEKLLASCDPGTAKGIRDLALMSLLTDSGLRSGEARGIRVNQLEFEVQIGYGAVNRVLVTAKGGRRAYGYFGQRTAGYLRRWLEVRELVAQPGIDEIFVSTGGTTPGRPLTRHGLRTILKKIGISAGVNQVSPHAFRRAFACLLELAGASTRVTQLLGRWEQMEMVAVYTRDLEAARLYSQYAPMDRTINADDKTRNS